MSVLPAEVQGALSQLLQALASPDNSLRSQAEEQLNNDWTTNQPDMLLMGLVEQLQASEDASVGATPMKPTFLRVVLTRCRLDPLPPSCFENRPRRIRNFLAQTKTKSFSLPSAPRPGALYDRNCSRVLQGSKSTLLGTKLETQSQRLQENMSMPV